MASTAGRENITLSGYPFIKETLEPPQAFFSGTPHQRSVCSFLKLPLNKQAPLYFTAFRYDDKTFTRQELCQAWSYGFNGSHFHDCLSVAALAESKIDGNFWIEFERISLIRREWKGLFVELNLALALLYECERTHFIPAQWKTPGPYNLRDLHLSTSQLLPQTPATELTFLFLRSAERLIEMEKSGYAEDFKSYARTLQGGLAFWVYEFPKGDHTVKDIQGIEEGRKSRLEDVVVPSQNNLLQTNVPSFTEEEEVHGEDSDDGTSIADSMAPLLKRIPAA